MKVATPFYRLIQNVLWGAVFLLLPLTSFPLITSTLGVHSVAPAAALPLGVLFLVWFLPHATGQAGKIPRQVLPLFAFVVIALIACAASFLIPFPPFRSPNLWANFRESLLTLGVGVSFFLLTSTWLNNQSKVRFALQLIHVGGSVIILWSLVQAYMWYTHHAYPSWMFRIQEHITANGRLFEQRVTGLAFEPSWLAHQLNLLYLPLWLAFSVQGTSVFRIRFWRLSVENLLLLGGAIVLFLSFSRVGWLAFLVTLAFLLLWAHLNLIRKSRDWLQARFRLQAAQWVMRIVLPLIMGCVLLALYAGLFLGAGYALSRLDPRMRDLFRLELLRTEGLTGFANRLVFAERLVYWQTGYLIFGDYPWLGVGLGNAGYFFPQKMISFGWALTEINDLMFRNASLPNTKSLWVRLLAETGITGFATFLTWLYVIAISAKALIQKAHPLGRTLGWAASLGLFALLVEGFSVDTFALPYFWVLFGLATAAITWLEQPSSMSTRFTPEGAPLIPPPAESQNK